MKEISTISESIKRSINEEQQPIQKTNYFYLIASLAVFAFSVKICFTIFNVYENVYVFINELINTGEGGVIENPLAPADFVRYVLEGCF